MNHEELTPEEQNAEYLRANPVLEQRMWADWVLTVCGWQKLDPPTDGQRWADAATKVVTDEASMRAALEGPDEASTVAQEKADQQIQKKLETVKNRAAFDDAFDWQESSDDDEFEYEASEA